MAASAAAGRAWDPTVSLRLGHPALVLLERCRGGGGARPFKAILAHLLRLGLAFETFPMSRLLHFATVTSPQHVREAELLFQHFTPRPNIYIYNLMLSAAAARASSSSPPLRAAALYRSMLASSLQPDEHTFLALLRSVERLSAGRQVHAQVVLNGFHSRVYLRNSLIKMYLDAGDVEMAELMFRSAPASDTVSCNIMLSGYVKEGSSGKALRLVRSMASMGIAVDHYTVVALLTCCGRLKNALLGRSVHGVVVRRMSAGDCGLILTNALLDMYAKCGKMNAAMRVFGEAVEKDDISWNTMVAGFANAGMLDLASRFFSGTPYRDIISWNALLAGFARYKEFGVVIKLFDDMLASCVKPDNVTAVTLISATAGTGSLNQGKSIHCWAVKEFGHQDVFLASALVDMYCKCGNVKIAHSVFEKALDKDVTLWTAMISGLAFHGHGTKALDLFWKMQDEAIAPNGVTLLAVLSACSHAGLLGEGCRIFYAMKQKFSIEPGIEHFGCMVDLLARSGRLTDAVGLARKMPMRPSRSIWGSILSASLACQNTEVAEIASKELLHLDPTEEGGYVLLSNLYASGGHWNYSDKVRESMEMEGVRKSAGASSFGC
ncbi:pentatricopeptide repeat-containing protein At3g04750, mitochondrial [Phragmites australis]|uniref:pentatricopeptide repeat-containing protein At3g04750, mitochondrial n=1 Tax=Phragmites australis TaxID=29695 RepID=UPI002D78AD4E|nr:pentatricopeptide repeat-containing protein At3g04750, mitochondrial [Phragmites australis]